MFNIIVVALGIGMGILIVICVIIFMLFEMFDMLGLKGGLVCIGLIILFLLISFGVGYGFLLLIS